LSGTIDPHGGRIVVVEEERDEIEITHVRRQRIVERPHQQGDVVHRRRLHARLETLLRAHVGIGGILAVDLAGCPDRARHQFRAVAAADAHIEHGHPGAHAGEGQKLDRVAPPVGLAVGVAAIGRGDDRGVILRRRRVRRRLQRGERKEPNNGTPHEPHL
jgi:hypothetical protein